MIPEGIYAAAVVPVETPTGPLSVQFGPATKNSPFSAALSFEIINGPCAGQRLTSFLYFGDKAGKSGKTTFERSIESLRICGFTGDDLDKFSDQHPDQEVSLTVKHETYTDDQGVTKTTAKVAWINSPMRGFVIEKPLASNDLRKFSAQFKGSLKRIPPVVTRKAERQAPSPAPSDEDGGSGWHGNDTMPPPSGPPPGSDDGIPF